MSESLPLTEAQLQDIAARTAGIIRKSSKGVGEVPKATTLEGIYTIPALRFNGGVPEVVEAPVALLQETAEKGVQEAVNAAGTAAEAALKAGEKADAAAAAANKAAGNAEAAVELFDEAFDLVTKAAESAVKAAGSAAAAAAQADTAAERADKISDHRDKIIDGYWHRWNEKTDEYENTGEIAKGNLMYATFEIDPATGGLLMNTDKEYTGANFVLTDGVLAVVI